MKKKWLSIVLVVSLLLGFTIALIYYGDAESLHEIKVSIHYFEVEEIHLTNCSILIIINISNPSGRDIYDLSSSFEIFIENISIGKGGFSGVNIPSNAVTRIEVPINMMYSGLADAAVEAIKNIWRGESNEVSIIGELNSSTLFGLARVSYHFKVTKIIQ